MKNKDNFSQWLIDKGKKPDVVRNYITGIRRISAHLSQETGSEVNLFSDNISQKDIARAQTLFAKNGKYAQVGETSNGTYRNALERFAEWRETRTPNHWLVYWRKDQVEEAVSDRLVDHAASEQFSRVQSGDLLWICGRGKTDQLVTVGPLKVLDVVGQTEAERRLPYQPWKAKFHAMAAADEELAAREVSLTSIVGKLRFNSKVSPRLDSATPLGQQLQRIRQLTKTSANLLGQLWESQVDRATADYEVIQSKLKQLGKLDKEVTVLRRLEQSFLRKYLFGSGDKGTCAICGSVLPVSLLIAAHIKPRSKCTDAERRDYTNNVVPMCLLGCDALFECGLVVINEGKVQVRMEASSPGKLKALFDQLNGRPAAAWKPGRFQYFRWHANVNG